MGAFAWEELVRNVLDKVRGKVEAEDVQQGLAAAFDSPTSEFEPTIESLSNVVVAHLSRSADPLDALQCLDGAELWLIAACRDAHPVAIREFESRYVS